jgi:lipopolysaccharide/colanic/teichoic acid biosynthesis glycosyltransferase
VVEDFNALPHEQQQQLVRLHAEGAEVLSALGWSEQVLQRFAPDLLRGEFAAPLLLVAALLIRLEERGPVFYGQVRSRCAACGWTLRRAVRSGLAGEIPRVD